MTRRTFQSTSGRIKIEPPSPERLPNGSSIENFDGMSAQSGDSTYAAHRHHRQNSSWTSPSQYTELVGPYGGQQRTPCPIQTSFPQPKLEPCLPSIHDLTYPPLSTPATYTYGSSAGPYGDHRNYAIKAEPPYPVKVESQSYYDSSQSRYGHSYQQVNRPSAPPLDYGGYPSMYHYKSIAFPSPYPVEYIPSPTSPHHPVSPTVSNGGDCLGAGGRKRRGNLPKGVTDYLKRWFMAHLEHPYPSEDEKQQFAHDTNLSIPQVRSRCCSGRDLD